MPILEAPGYERVGRFGWKDQHASLLSFSADASLNEMGISNRLEPHDVTTVCKTTKDPEDRPDKLDMAAIDHYAQFMRGTMAPPRDSVLAATQEACEGERIFENIGCGICHSACDVVTWNPEYLGPAPLNRAWTLVNDVRDAAHEVRIDAASGSAGCHACHSHMSCTEFCPRAISPTFSIAGLKRAMFWGRS